MEGKVIYKDLSYKIMGVIFDVYNEVGGEQYEKFIQKAIAVGLKDADLKYTREEKVPLIYKGQKIGNYYPDFIVESKVVLEVKRGYGFSKFDFKQVEGYLQVTGLKLGIIVLFTKTKVKFTRVLN